VIGYRLHVGHITTRGFSEHEMYKSHNGSCKYNFKAMHALIGSTEERRKL